MWNLHTLHLSTLIWAAALLLPACGAAPVKPTASPEATPSASKPSPPVLTPRQRSVNALLGDAESAMAQGRFSLPAHDNAHDRFRAVQLLDPGNKQALAGLHSILLVYVDRVQQALSAGRLHAAAADLRQAEQLFPGTELLPPLRTELERRAKAAATAAETPVPTDGRERIVLPAQPLAEKTEEVKQLLVQLAHRVRQSDESIMIYARSDAEGRWVYKTMKDAVDEYRIRGDIRINRQPAIELLSPME
jgi:signal transduction histidine kinase